MSQEDMISAIVREVLTEMNGGRSAAKGNGAPAPAPVTTNGAGLDPAHDYPLSEKRPDLVKTATGKHLADITMEAAMKGEINADELRITPETLELQAQIAEKAGRPQSARNMRRAGELTRLPDDRILQMYNALRPYRSSKAELLAIADELETKYSAKVNAAFVREACDVYERRGRLKQD